MPLEFFSELDRGHKLAWLNQRERPFFIYDEVQLELNVHRLKQLWKLISPVQQDLFFSVKSNPNLHLIKKLAPLVSGFDASSMLELELLTQAGVSTSRITLSGPAKTDAFLREAIRRNVRAVHLDSIDEYNALQAMGAGELNLSLRVATPELAEQKLGLSVDEITQVLDRHAGRPFSGLHAYLGRDRFTGESFRRQLAQMVSLVDRSPAKFVKDTPFYFGAGFPDIEKIEAVLPSTVRLPGSLHLEAGRAVIGTAGSYFAKVLSVKSRPGQRRLVIIDGGWQHVGTHLLSPIYGGAGVHVLTLRGGTIHRTESEPTAVYGSLCLARDIIHPNVDLPADLQRGDWLAFGPCGAYGISASPSQFIGQNAADEFLIDSRKKETLAHPTPIGAKNFQPYQLSFE